MYTFALHEKPSDKIINRSLYQKARIGKLPHFCNEMKKCNQSAMFAISKLAAFLDNANCIV